MAYDWFRSWHGAPTDPKWLLIARKAGVVPGIVSALFWAMTDYASQNSDRGNVDGFDTETYAAYSGFDESDIIAIIAAMRVKGIITKDNRLAAWDNRQPKREDQSSTERVRKHRAKTASVTDEMKRSETQCNATEHTGTIDKIRGDKIRLKKTEDARPLLVVYQEMAGETGNPPAKFRTWFDDVTGRYGRNDCIAAFAKMHGEMNAGLLNGSSKWDRVRWHLEHPFGNEPPGKMSSEVLVDGLYDSPLGKVLR